MWGRPVGAMHPSILEDLRRKAKTHTLGPSLLAQKGLLREVAEALHQGPRFKGGEPRILGMRSSGGKAKSCQSL